MNKLLTGLLITDVHQDTNGRLPYVPPQHKDDRRDRSRPGKGWNGNQKAQKKGERNLGKSWIIYG